MKGWMYILQCADDSYYTGSTNNLELRLQQHQNGEGAKHTKKRLPVSLIYFEEFQRVDEAFYREKQVQGWTRKKKEALIKGMAEKLHEMAKCLNETTHVGFGSAQPTDSDSATNSDAPMDSTPRTRPLSGAETTGTQTPKPKTNPTTPTDSVSPTDSTQSANSSSPTNAITQTNTQQHTRPHTQPSTRPLSGAETTGITNPKNNTTLQSTHQNPNTQQPHIRPLSGAETATSPSPNQNLSKLKVL